MVDSLPKTGGAGGGAKVLSASNPPATGSTATVRAPTILPLVLKRQTYMNSIKRIEEMCRADKLAGVSLPQKKHLQKQLNDQIAQGQQA